VFYRPFGPPDIPIASPNAVYVILLMESEANIAAYLSEHGRGGNCSEWMACGCGV
jgi:hypothetical protein